MPAATTKIGKLRAQLIALLQEHERDELVARGIVSKERPKPPPGKRGRRADQDMIDALMDIRESGAIPWSWIADETRKVEDYTGDPSIKDGVLAQLPLIALDPWGDRTPMVLTESRSLAGVLRTIASEYRVRIASINGQCSGFLRTEIAPRLKPGDRVRSAETNDPDPHPARAPQPADS
jgi:hypothetical protein